MNEFYSVWKDKNEVEKQKFELTWKAMHFIHQISLVDISVVSKKLGIQKLKDLLGSGRYGEVSGIFYWTNRSFISCSKVLNTSSLDFL